MADENSKTEHDRTLAEVIAEAGVLSVKQAAAVTLQLVKAVGDLHAEGKVHRQICVDTVRLDQAMSAKLEPTRPEVTLGGMGVDLALCPPQLQNMPPVSLPAAIDAAQQVLTEAGIPLDSRQIDFYQLGALLCFMASGHNVCDYLRSCKAKASVPEVIRPVIDRALGLNSKDCFQSTDCFISELGAIISGKPTAKTGPFHLPDSVFAESLSKSEAGLGPPRDAGGAADGSLPFATLGHYRIVERIGHGGMGDVYKGYEQDLDRFVAIKVLPAELGQQQDSVKRFHAEAAAIAKLDHPNVVRVYYSGEDQGHHFFAMQYVDGETLADLLERRKKLTASEALPIVEQCLAGINAAHKSGLIHRDIKPGNILLDRSSRRALVTDFGVVKAIKAQAQITVTGTIMGTADYIAPEQARGQAIDSRADLYAMGVLMYQMLSSRLPFHAESATSMMFQHAYEPPPPLSEIAPDVPGSLGAIVMKLMSKKPKDRYQSADEVLADLHSIRLTPAWATGTSQTSIVEAPDFDTTAELPSDLLRFVPTGRLDRLRNWIVDFFGAHAPQVIQRMQTTGQQVDGSIAEYERRREQLAQLRKEARFLASDLERQANSHANAAQLAGQRAEGATNTVAKHTALKQQEESEQTAAELAQLTAEQQQQCEDIEMRLVKLDAKLAQLRSQRNVLNARLNAAEARRKAEGAKSAKWPLQRKLAFTLPAFVVCCSAVILYYSLKPGPQIIGRPGRLQAWGANKFGQCNVPAGDDFVAVAAGHFHVLALKTDGTLLAWGSNSQGQCNVPIDNRFAAIAAGFNHSLGLRPDGTLAAWGDNSKDQCNVPAGDGFVEIAAGSLHNMALTSDGTIVAWGDNSQGQCDVPKGNYFAAIAAGEDHSVAIRTNGTLVAWGGNRTGQCNIPPGDDFVAISAGVLHSMALRSDGTFVAWGYRLKGQTDFLAGERLKALAVGRGHSMVMKADGSLVAWGDNRWGQCNVPAGKDFQAISVGRYFSVAIVTSEPKIISSGLVAHWKFDEGSGNIAYDSVGNNHGTIRGAKWVTREFGGALSFNGVDDYVNIPAADTFDFGTGDFSVSVWFKTGVSKTQHIVDFRQKDGDPHIEIYTATGPFGFLGTHLSPGDSRIPYTVDSLNDDSWHNVCVTLKNGHIGGYKLYLDGTQVGQSTYAGTLSNWHTIKIGGENVFYPKLFKGLIDEVAIYNRALSADEIKARYQALAPAYRHSEINVSGLIGYWKFDEGNGNIAYDSVGQNHGTIHGAKWTTGKVGDALSFDGDGEVQTTLNIDQNGSTDITMMAWVYPTNKSTIQQHVVSSDNGGFDWSILRRREKWHAFTGDGAWYSGFREDVDQWQHVAVVFKSGKDIIFYKNGTGQPKGSAPSIDPSSNNIAIGNNPGYGFCFVGKIDEVRIYNKALSTEEILRLYQSQADVYPGAR